MSLKNVFFSLVLVVCGFSAYAVDEYDRRDVNLQLQLQLQHQHQQQHQPRRVANRCVRALEGWQIPVNVMPGEQGYRPVQDESEESGNSFYIRRYDGDFP